MDGWMHAWFTWPDPSLEVKVRARQHALDFGQAALGLVAAQVQFATLHAYAGPRYANQSFKDKATGRLAQLTENYVLRWRPDLAESATCWRLAEFRTKLVFAHSCWGHNNTVHGVCNKSCCFVLFWICKCGDYILNHINIIDENVSFMEQWE